MYKTTVAAVGAALLFNLGGGALAADLGAGQQGSMKDRFPEILPLAFSWRGFYIGADIGGAIGRGSIDAPFEPSIHSDTVSMPGGFAGVELGYNLQIYNVVLGIEADANWASLDGSNLCLAFPGDRIPTNCHVHTNAFGTVTGRFGLSLGYDNRALLYGKAGAAWTNNEIHIENNNAPCEFSSVLADSKSFTRWGWTVGAGVEYALTPAWAVKAEYDFMDFGSVDVRFPQDTAFSREPAVEGGVASISEQAHVFKIGVNYRIGAETPQALAPLK